MKLLTDDRIDLNAFKSDFDRACRKLAKVLARRGDAPEEVAVQLIDATRDAIDCQFTAGAHHVNNWHMIEMFHAMDWLMIIAARWCDNEADGLASPEKMTDHAAEMFVGIAQHVAREISGGMYPSPNLVRTSMRWTFPPPTSPH